MIERKVMSQCISSDYCKGWNDAVNEVEKQDVFQNTEKLAETAIRIILEKSEIFDLKTEYLPLMSALGKLLYYEDREK